MLWKSVEPVPIEIDHCECGMQLYINMKDWLQEDIGRERIPKNNKGVWFYGFCKPRDSSNLNVSKYELC